MGAISEKAFLKVKVSRTQSITHLQTRLLAYTHHSGSPTLWLAYVLRLWLAYVSGSPTYTRISTVARATLSLSLAYLRLRLLSRSPPTWGIILRP